MLNMIVFNDIWFVKQNMYSKMVKKKDMQFYMEHKKISRFDGWLLQSPDDQISNHSSYRSQNKWQKWKGLDFNNFHLKWMVLT